MDFNNPQELQDFIEARKHRAEAQLYKYKIEAKSSRKWSLWNKDNNKVYEVTKLGFSSELRCTCNDFKYRVIKGRKVSKLHSKEWNKKNINCKHIEIIRKNI